MADVSGLATTVDLATVDGIVDDIKAVTTKIDTGLVADGLVYQFTANALELAPTGGSAPTVEQIRSEMDTNSTKLANLDAKVSTRSSHTAADVVTALGTGSTLTACATAAGFSTHSASDVAALILVTPAQKIVTDANGYVTYSNAAPPSASTISSQVASDLASAHGAGSWETATGFSTLDAAGVRTAMGLASANLDTQLADLPTVAEFEARSLVAADYVIVSDLSSLATATNVTDAVTSIETYGDTKWLTSDVSGLSTLDTTDVENAVWDSKMADHLDVDTTGYALSVAGSSSDPWITALPGPYTAGQAGYLIGRSLSGGGANVVTYTLSTGEFADVTVEVYSDAAYANLVATGVTDSFGSVTFYLDSGTYYLLRKKAGYDFDNPDTKSVP
jgi:hypothetical protein